MTFFYNDNRYSKTYNKFNKKIVLNFFKVVLLVKTV